MKSRRKKVSNCKETIAATNENEKKSSADKANNENKEKHAWKRRKNTVSLEEKILKLHQKEIRDIEQTSNIILLAGNFF